MISTGLTKELLLFRKQRDWEKFHNLRTLSVSLAVESAELLELTQWVSDDDVQQVVANDANRILDEVADISILLTYLIHDLGIDIEQAVRDKLKKNAEKYPVEKAKGISTKYDRL